MAKGIAVVAALVGWAGLILQLVLIIGQVGPGLGIWRFVGFFTILTNFAAAVVATAVALGSRTAAGGAWSSARARLMAATSIVMVGLTYSIALRSLWSPTGLQKIADVALHDATPLLFTALWLASPHPGLKWREIGWALVPPALYAIYALGRGAIDGWYAYWFLNPDEQTIAELVLSIGAMLAGFAVVAAMLVAADRWLAEDDRS